jgi:hypothetical protein
MTVRTIRRVVLIPSENGGLELAVGAYEGSTKYVELDGEVVAVRHPHKREWISVSGYEVRDVGGPNADGLPDALEVEDEWDGVIATAIFKSN